MQVLLDETKQSLTAERAARKIAESAAAAKDSVDQTRKSISASITAHFKEIQQISSLDAELSAVKLELDRATKVILSRDKVISDLKASNGNAQKEFAAKMLARDSVSSQSNFLDQLFI